MDYSTGGKTWSGRCKQKMLAGNGSFHAFKYPLLYFPESPRFFLANTFSHIIFEGIQTTDNKSFNGWFRRMPTVKDRTEEKK